MSSEVDFSELEDAVEQFKKSEQFQNLLALRKQIIEEFDNVYKVFREAYGPFFVSLHEAYLRSEQVKLKGYYLRTWGWRRMKGLR